MSKIILIILILTANILNAQQVCKTDAEVPSTTPGSRFTDNGDVTISDSLTKLMWIKCPIGLAGVNCDVGTATKNSWSQALAVANTAAMGGHNDWRLPNVKELRTLIEKRCYTPTINSNYFPNTPYDESYWSSTPYANSTLSAWYVSYYYGISNLSSRSSSLYMRLVRNNF